MGQILSRILGSIFGNNNNKKKLPDLEQGLLRSSSQETDQYSQVFLPSSPSSSSSSSSPPRSYNWLQHDELAVEVVKEEITTHQPPAFTITTKDDDEEIIGGGVFGDNNDDDDDGVTVVSGPSRRRITLRRDEEQEIGEVVFEEINVCQVSSSALVSDDDEIRWIKHYNSTQKILLVGEGDFSFSSCLATAFISASNIIATSLDSTEFLRKHYRKAISNIENLQKRGSMVMHEVNVGEMANNRLLKDLKFDRIIYNFPLAGFFHHECRHSQILRNRTLVAMFMDNGRKLLYEDGEIHITHKCNGFFLDWNLDRLGSNYGLRLLEEVRFHRRDYPGYSTKYGFGGDKSFNCNPSKTYKFGLKSQ